jgi:hypothetical protein
MKDQMVIYDNEKKTQLGRVRGPCSRSAKSMIVNEIWAMSAWICPKLAVQLRNFLYPQLCGMVIFLIEEFQHITVQIKWVKMSGDFF